MWLAQAEQLNPKFKKWLKDCSVLNQRPVQMPQMLLAWQFAPPTIFKWNYNFDNQEINKDYS
jgi:hypothetical protein